MTKIQMLILNAIFVSSFVNSTAFAKKELFSNQQIIYNNKVNILARAFMQQNAVEGMSLAVIDKEKIHIFNYGFANTEKKIPTTNHTIYTIASFTKTFTATLTAIAETEGKLNLDNAFVKYFPDVKNNKYLNDISLRQLLGHVSALPFDFNPHPKNYDELVNKLYTLTLEKLPGSEYRYSNAGIGTVGYVLENIYAKPYAEILNNKIFLPLNMSSTYLNVPSEKEKYIAEGHDMNNHIVAYNKDIDVWFAAASLKSTIADMAKYLYAHINAATYSNATFSKAIFLAHENTYCFDDNISCEQLAWQAHHISVLNNSNGDTYFLKFDENGNPIFNTKKIIKGKKLSTNNILIDKTGSGYGMSGYMAYIPNKKIGVVILLNKWIGDERIKLGRDILKQLS